MLSRSRSVLSRWPTAPIPRPRPRPCLYRIPQRAIHANGKQHRVSITSAGIELAPRLASEPKRMSFPSIWLRCDRCVNQDTMQRGFDTFQLPDDLAPKEAVEDSGGVHILWGPDDHRSYYPWDFLSFYQENDHRSPEEIEHRYWGASISEKLPTVEFSKVMDESSEEGIAELTRHICEYGFVFVPGCPYDTPDATEKLLERIAFVRVTHYGGFYDFIPDLALADTAYTNLALPAHTDTTYFSDPAGLQSFHLLSHIDTKPVEKSSKPKPAHWGGQSLLVDGFLAAAILKEEAPEAYDILTKVKLPWHASGNKGITISPDQRYPVLETDESTGRLRRVRWNNDDRGVVPFDNGLPPATWYDAAKIWNSILTRPEVELWTQLKPGTPLSNSPLPGYREGRYITAANSVNLTAIQSSITGEFYTAEAHLKG